MRESAPCGLIDILPTLAGFAGAPVPEAAEGMDLLRHSASAAGADAAVQRSDPRTLPLWTLRHPTSPPARSSGGQLKGTVNFVTGKETLFDLESDPGERSRLEMDSSILEEIEYYWAQPMLVTPPAMVDDNVDDNLRDLGYIR